MHEARKSTRRCLSVVFGYFAVLDRQLDDRQRNIALCEPIAPIDRGVSPRSILLDQKKGAVHLSLPDIGGTDMQSAPSSGAGASAEIKDR